MLRLLKNSANTQRQFVIKLPRLLFFSGLDQQQGIWSSGMVLSFGARGLDSKNAPYFKDHVKLND